MTAPLRTTTINWPSTARFHSGAACPNWIPEQERHMYKISCNYHPDTKRYKNILDSVTDCEICKSFFHSALYGTQHTCKFNLINYSTIVKMIGGHTHIYKCKNLIQNGEAQRYIWERRRMRWRRAKGHMFTMLQQWLSFPSRSAAVCISFPPPLPLNKRLTNPIKAKSIYCISVLEHVL